MPQYNGPVYSQGPTAVGPYNLQGYQPTFGYNPQQTYMPQTPQPVPSQEPMAISNAARDITENQNTNYRQLHDELVAYTVPNPNGYYGCQQNCYQSCGC